MTETETVFWLRRLHAGLLSWHFYKSKESRERWAAKFRADGDSVWVEGEDVLVHSPPRGRR